MLESNWRAALWSGLFAATVSLDLPAAAPVTPAAWTAYFSSQDQRAEWAQTVRGLGRQRRTGEDDAQESVEAVDFEALRAALREDAAPHDVIVPLGWIRSGKNAAQAGRLVEEFESHGAGARKRALTEAVARIEREYRNGRIYWQIGNEINSRHMAQSLGEAGKTRRGELFDDETTIPTYAEFVFAPTVEALQDASRDVYGDPRRIRIVLGSIANVHRAGARAWLDRLMEYRLQGRFAPRLTGTRVADHVSIVAVHYAVSADDPPWETIFDALDSRWRKGGTVEGVWATEEIGKRRAEQGAGAATAIRVAASLLSRAAQLQLSPEQLRGSFYAWRKGPRGQSGNEGMQALFESLGPGRLADLSADLRLDAGGGIKAYGFAAASSPSRRVIVIVKRGDGSANLQSVSIPGSRSSKYAATLFTTSGAQPLALEIATKDGRTVLRPSHPLSVSPEATLLIREVNY